MTWEDLIAQTGRVLTGNTTSRPRQPRQDLRHRSPLGRRAAPCRTTAMPTPSEDEEQCALIAWRNEIALPQEPRLDLLYHCPNGKQRGAAAAGQLKAMGVKRHIPDLFLAVPRHGFHGLYIELKALDGTVPPGQKTLHAQLRDQGYCVAVAFGWLAAARELCRYLDRLDLALQLGDAL